MKQLKQEELHNILGDCYVPHTSVNKDEYLTAINKFINKVPSFKPGLEELNKKTRCGTSWFTGLQRRTGWKVLRLNYFYLNQTLYENITRNGCNICIMVDDDDVKHIVRKSSHYAQAKEINCTLGISTLKNLYKLFVEDVMHPMAVLRGLKRVEELCNEWNIKNQDLLWLKTDGRRRGFKQIRKIKFLEVERDKIALKVCHIDYFLNRGSTNLSQSNNLITYISTLPRMFRYLGDMAINHVVNDHEMLTHEEFKALISAHVNEIREELSSVEDSIISTCCAK